MFTRFKNLSLKSQIALATTAFMIAGLAGIVGMIQSRASSQAMTMAASYAVAEAQSNARAIASVIDNGFAVARASLVLSNAQLTAGKVDRAQMLKGLELVVDKNPGIYGGWSQFEAGVLGDDAKFIGSPGHDDQGRFAGYYRRDHGKVVAENQDPTQNWFDDDYYAIPAKTLKAALLEPYEFAMADGSKVLMTSTALPVVVAGKFVGVAGADLSLADLQKMVDDIHPYGTGYAALLTGTGTVVGYRDTAMLGKPAASLGLDDAIVKAAGSAAEATAISVLTGGETFQVIVPVRFAATDTVWSLAIMIPAETIGAEARTLRNFAILLGLGATAASLLGAALLGGALSRPIRGMTNVMNHLAAGNTDVHIDGTQLKNEMGDMARALITFQDNAREKIKLQQEQKEQELRSKAEQRAMLDRLAGSFESSVKAATGSIGATAGRMEISAETMLTAAEQTNGQSSAVAAAAEQASSNVQTVAAATEELTSSIKEISRQITESSQVASKAVGEASKTKVLVRGLDESAQKIGKVVALITDIAEQTNLLALNATIEAARAGEAGKGFAVVASEVKNLATQTTRATEEISGQINGIQEATRSSVAAIEGIFTTIGQIDQISTTIASAIEEQTAATAEIARNVEQAALGTQDVSTNIVGVTKAVGETGQVSSDVLTAARELTRQSESLLQEVDGFLASIKQAA
ncbi:MAG: methyl-accepting chemotaxis protein [Proteobacteria bacterium]|nr:methyl-accepting chemotaxis protein [Pseudomonadota bacterium]